MEEFSMSLGIFYTGESFHLEVDLNDESGAPIMVEDLEDVKVVLEVNKKEVATLVVDDGITYEEESNVMLLDVAAEDTALWNSGKLVGRFVFEIDGKVTIEEVELYKVVKA
jgi:hypothetical protein